MPPPRSAGPTPAAWRLLLTDDLAAFVRSRDAAERAFGAWALGHFRHDGRAVLEVVWHTPDDPDPRVRRAGVLALLAATGPMDEAIERVVPLLRDPVVEVRAGVDALFKARSHSIRWSAARGLIDVLRRGDSDARTRAARHVGLFHSEAADATEVLLDLARCPEKPLRRAVLQALRWVAPGRTRGLAEAYLDALDEPDDEVARDAAVGLAGLGPHLAPAVDRLATMLETRPHLRGRVLSALAQVGPFAARMAPSLLSALGDDSGSVRTLAILALVRLEVRTPDVVQAVLARLTDSDRQVRKEAAVALGAFALPVPGLREALVRALDDPDAEVAERSARSLASLGAGDPVAQAALADVYGRRNLPIADIVPRSAAAAALSLAPLVAAVGRARVNEVASACKRLEELGEEALSDHPGLWRCVELLQVLDREARGVVGKDEPATTRSALEELESLRPRMSDADREAVDHAVDAILRESLANDLVSGIVRVLRALPVLGTRARPYHDPVARALGSASRQTREAALECALALGLDVGAILTRQCLDAPGEPGTWATRAIAATPGDVSDCVEELLFALAEGTSEEQRRACAALGALGQRARRALDPLDEALAKGPTLLAASAASALAHLGPAGTERLLRSLEAGSPVARMRSAEAIGQMGPAASTLVNHLVAAAGDEDWQVRREAAVALGRIGVFSPRIERALAPLADDPHPALRQRVRSVLERLRAGKTPEAGSKT